MDNGSDQNKPTSHDSPSPDLCDRDDDDSSHGPPPQRSTATVTRPRVSFDDKSDIMNYEDVVTLHVPTKDNVWLSCKSKQKRPFKWFRNKRKSKGSISSLERLECLSNNGEANHAEHHINSATTDSTPPVYENQSHTNASTNNPSARPETPSSMKTATMQTTISSPTNGQSHEPNHQRNGSTHGTVLRASEPDTYPDHHSDSSDPENGEDGPEPEEEDERMIWTTTFLAAMSIILIVLTFPISLIYCVRIVAEYERAVVLRMGNLISKGRGTKGPGLFFILPCIDSVRKVDLRTVTFAIPPQELLTRDSVTVSVDAVVYYRVLNPVASVLNIEDAARSTRLLAQTTIRNILGTKDLAQILMDRDEISTAMQTNLDSTTEAWGVKVERIEIKDVRLPIQLQRAMAAEAEAAREARAKVIAAQGEHDAARSLKKAARIISTSPMAFQLRYLQTLCAIAAEKNSTIFFPVPIDIMQNLGDLTSGQLGQLPAGPKKAGLPAEFYKDSEILGHIDSIWPHDDTDTNSDTV